MYKSGVQWKALSAPLNSALIKTRGKTAYCFYKCHFSTSICILITTDWLLLNRGHTMRGRIYSALIKMCYSADAVLYMSMSPEKYHLTKATNEGFFHCN